MYIEIILKTVLLYFFIILVYRVMGKKEVGQLSVIDLIVTILIAELVALAISSNKSIFMSIIPISALVCVQIFLSFITLKNEKIRNIIEGKPVVIIKNGKLVFSEMSKIRYSLDDLIMQLRLQGINNIENVKYAVLENNGQLSILNNDTNYPLPLILDGIIDYKVLDEIKKDYNWVFKILEKNNVELEEVFYAFYANKKLFIVKKTELL